MKGGQEQSVFLQTLLFTAFLAAVQKIITYALVSTRSLVSSGWEHVKRIMHHCDSVCISLAKYICKAWRGAAGVKQRNALEADIPPSKDFPPTKLLARLTWPDA